MSRLLPSGVSSYVAPMSSAASRKPWQGEGFDLVGGEVGVRRRLAGLCFRLKLSLHEVQTVAVM